ncbi:NADH:flavorubredoxin reductase NorW [Pectobacterium aroidearum]|uniref:NADH:flavorubredoxin reductase NorW n=1 Tax=Pectobacterium aroidearum TaxID=1201031 RepID=UPI002114D0AC|nr:NADH:flavorubredoxin reductase NorW [Pectobacterium aroidearum]UUE59723.1 NADH:flavorubredoxin reductase NorW [Pectobacterium aroidearum]UUE72528.1 NADH:flavorubredoxin reductase NorW [Pectobacterium aroidearum]UUE75599.1 NADH:flavorubredoxin reductase NorW [Pectobacterium aroidearum]UUE81178.1 NADH:flavorubredoxin reductase NorW [Pectobacterium aroidearum]
MKDIVIIGAGFAARQLIRQLRKLDAHRPIRLITADSGDEYNKPDLSHVMSLQQHADDLTKMQATAFAEENRITLLANTRVTAIDRHTQQVVCGTERYDYHKLVFAAGASAIVPPIPGCEHMLTLNSQQEYRTHESRLWQAERILVLGAGLIGTELAMDLGRAGKQVTLVDCASSILPALMPPEVSARLQFTLTQQGASLHLNTTLQQLEKTETGVRATFTDGRTIDVDDVLSAIGLQPNTQLAKAAGLAVQKGIQTNTQLQTSDPQIYALGDCAEIGGKLLPFLQPIQLSAMTLAKNLLGASEALALPPMLVKIKTPLFPLQMAGGTTSGDLHWQQEWNEQGMVAKALDSQQVLRAFVVGGERMKEAFPLLRQLSTVTSTTA